VLRSKPTKFAMLAAVCLSSNSASSHQAMPVWNIQMTKAQANDDLQIYRRDIVALEQMIANLEAMISHPETDECYEVNRSLNLPAEECVSGKRKVISGYKNAIAEDQVVIDNGVEAFTNKYLNTEARDKEYLRTHWAEFTDKDILDCELAPIASYTALKICLVDWHGKK
jgi:hypothetical protein